MATITYEKFTIFGSGFDSTRNDSGKGAKEPEVLNFRPDQASFDSTGQYCWVLINNGGLRKFDTKTWQTVDQGSVPTNCNRIYHPMNIENNLGFAMNGSTAYLFDLTTNEIINSGAWSGGLLPTNCDCVLVDDDTMRICSMSQTRATNAIWTLDLNDFSITEVSFYNSGFVGFIDSNSVFSHYDAEWFYQNGSIYSANANGGEDWRTTKSSTGNYGNVVVQGLTADGYIYLPSLIDGKWVMGKYTGLSAPDIETPTPIKKFGSFPSRPTLYTTSGHSIWYATYNSDRTMASFGSTDALYVTDFKDMWAVADGNLLPLAISDSMVLCYDFNNASKAKVVYY